jgi:hypothetical protein
LTGRSARTPRMCCIAGCSGYCRQVVETAEVRLPGPHDFGPGNTVRRAPAAHR